MKNILNTIWMALLMCLTLSACKDNENWRILPTPPQNYLRVVGDHQGWNPSAKPMGRLYATDVEGEYKGYVYLKSEFQATDKRDGSGTFYGMKDGKLSSEKDASKIKVSAPGYYRVTLNTKEMTQKIEPANFGVVGDATPGGWGTDTDMVYDPMDMKLKVTMQLSDGEIKFRANDAWTLNYGMGDKETDPLKEGGNNIKVSAGKYLIELDLSTPDYNFKLTSVK